MVSNDVVEDGWGEEVFVKEAVADAGTDLGRGCGFVQFDEMRGGERGFECGEGLEFLLDGVQGALENDPLDERTEFVESMPVGEFTEIVRTDDEADVRSGVFVAKFVDGIERVTGTGSECFTRVDKALRLVSEGFAEHGEAVVRVSSWRGIVLVRVPVGWDDADLAEWEAGDEVFDHRHVAVVDGVKRAAEHDNRMGGGAHVLRGVARRVQ